MKQKIGYITLLIRDYDEAIAFYRDKLDFHLIEDTQIDQGKRWVLMAPENSNGTSLLLAKASTPDQQKFIGNQTGGRVFFFLHTDHFRRDYEKMIRQGVVFLEDPREESYGTVAVFKDLYGNKWDLLELKKGKNDSC